MKKMIGSLLAIMLAALVVQAQKKLSVNRQKNQVEFKGYTICIIPATMGTYAYDVFKDRKLVLHQRNNPFTGRPVGLRHKEDAFKVAEWQIENREQQLASFNKWEIQNQQRLPATQKHASKSLPRVQPAFMQRVPLQVAKQLGIQP